MNEKIFIGIASYRDPELEKTIKSLLENAEKPELLDIYILNQVDLFSDYNCYIGDSEKYSNVKEIIVDFRESKGPCLARSKIWTNFTGDHKFFLQIDAHMRFIKNWDKYLKNMWYSINDQNAIISHYPCPYKLDTEELIENIYIKFAPKIFFKEHKVPILSSVTDWAENAPKIPEKSAFIGGNFMFGPSKAIKEVPYDPYIYFYGEENTYAARLWTHGYNIYAPNKILVYHLYPKDNEKKISNWHDNKEWNELEKKSIKRVRHLMKFEETNDKEALKEIEKYGFGNVRTFEEYEIFSGVSHKNQTIEEHTTKGLVNENYKI